MISFVFPLWIINKFEEVRQKIVHRWRAINMKGDAFVFDFETSKFL